MFNQLIKRAERNVLSSEITGSWAALQLKLNSFSPEFLNVGIVFFSEKTGFEIRLLENFNGLKALMPKQFDANEFELLLNITQESLNKSQSISEVILPTPTMRLSSLSFFSGSSPKSIVDWLFDQAITLNECKKERVKNTFKHKTNDEVINGVIDYLYKKDSLKVNSYIQKTPYEIQDNDGRSLYFNAPILTNNKVGTIASAWYKSWETIKSNILTAQMEVSAVAHHSRKEGALFIQRPGESIKVPKQELEIIDQNIDELIWRISRSGIKAIPSHGVKELGNEIISFVS